jgi:hypothetical protein
MKKAEKAKKGEKCFCPYCEEALVVTSCPFCLVCGAVFSYCVSCQITVLDREATNCPKCGEPLKKGGAKKAE